MGAHQFVPSRSIIFQSTPSFLTPYPSSSGSSLRSSGTATPFPFSRCATGVDDPDKPAIDEAEGDREGDGGGNALDGSRAIGRSFDGVDVPLPAFL